MNKLEGCLSLLLVLGMWGGKGLCYNCSSLLKDTGAAAGGRDEAESGGALLLPCFPGPTLCASFCHLEPAAQRWQGRQVPPASVIKKMFPTDLSPLLSWCSSLITSLCQVDKKLPNSWFLGSLTHKYVTIKHFCTCLTPRYYPISPCLTSVAHATYLVGSGCTPCLVLS